MTSVNPNTTSYANRILGSSAGVAQTANVKIGTSTRKVNDEQRNYVVSATGADLFEGNVQFDTAVDATKEQLRPFFTGLTASEANQAAQSIALSTGNPFLAKAADELADVKSARLAGQIANSRRLAASIGQESEEAKRIAKIQQNIKNIQAEQNQEEATA